MADLLARERSVGVFFELEATVPCSCGLAGNGRGGLATGFAKLAQPLNEAHFSQNDEPVSFSQADFP